MDPITLLIYLLIGVIILAIVWYAIRYLNLPAPVSQIVILVLVLIFLLYILRYTGVW